MQEKSYLLCESNEDCVKWWAHDLNDENLFNSIRTRARKSVNWRCPDCGTEFAKEVYTMVTPNKPICPSCGKKRYAEWRNKYDRYKHTPVSSVPELKQAWIDERDPNTVMVVPDWGGVYNDRVFLFKCPEGHHARVAPITYLLNGCPFCKARETAKAGFIEDEWPELAAEWSEENTKYKPNNTKHKSERKIVWKCIACGNKWTDTPHNRTRSYSACCPKCGKILGSLAWKYPHLAEEWDPENELSAWQVRQQTRFLPKWICKNDSNHRWETRIVNRINGAGCPYCTDSTKSRIELLFFEEANNVFESVVSGAKVSSELFSHDWTVDILINEHGERIAVEYDGSYWHKNKVIRDRQKSEELLMAGYCVVRLREDGLPSLNIDSKQYCEFLINPLSPKVEITVKKIKEFVSSIES